MEVDIDKYHLLIPVCLLGLTVLEKVQCQTNTDNQIMMNEGNKCLLPSVINLPPHRGEGAKFFCALRAEIDILPPPPLHKAIVRPCCPLYTKI